MRTARAEPAERGRLEIHPAVLRKIVEYAADGVPGTLRNERRLAGIDVGDIDVEPSRVRAPVHRPAVRRRAAPHALDAVQHFTWLVVQRVA